MTRVLDPASIAASFRAQIRTATAALGRRLRLVGVLAADGGPSATYADYTRRACDDVGVGFDLRHVARLDAERAVRDANDDPSVHGIIIYYPVFGTGQDGYLRDLVDPQKDIEGLHTYWLRRLYENRRYVDEVRSRKAVLPCTPLAVLKLIEAGGVGRPGSERPLAGLRACVFNRSEVVGRPLASMMANDGAEVVSFDIDGAQLFTPAVAGGAHEVRETGFGRREALAAADIIVTGVPSRAFEPVTAAEIRHGAACLNFSTLKNFSDDIVGKAGMFAPRVGPMTVTMALRNTLRLYHDYRA